MTPDAEIHESCDVAPSVTFVAPSEDDEPARVGARGTIRAETIVYPNVDMGEGFGTGHYALVREHTTIGDDVLVGSLRRQHGVPAILRF